MSLEINPAVNTGSGLSTNARRVYNTAPVVGPCVSNAGCKANYAQIVEAAMIGNSNFDSLQTPEELIPGLLGLSGSQAFLPVFGV